MIGGLLATLAGAAWARTALRYGVTALATLLFLLALRRSGERAVRLAEQLETTERSHDAQALGRRMLFGVSKDTFLRGATKQARTSICAPRVIVIYDWAWRKEQRSGAVTISVTCQGREQHVIPLSDRGRSPLPLSPFFDAGTSVVGI